MAEFDFTILGAGFAGLSLADALQEAGQKVIVIEKDEPGAGASGTPGALVNPATGRKGKKSWKAEGCYKAIRKNLEKIQKQSSQTTFQPNGVLRPAQTEKMARKMKAQFDKTEWPDDWCCWLSEKEIKQKHPGIHCVDGGLWLPVALTVNGKKYLNAYCKYLQNKKIKIKTNCRVEITQTDALWTTQTKYFTAKSKNLIFATGFGTISSSFWKALNLEPIKGQLAKFRTKEKLKFNHSISGLGYIANGPSEHTFMQGSTYEHDFDNLQTDKSGADYLREKLKRMLPQLAEKVELVSQWSGVRISTPNRKPVAGEHPDHQNLYVLTGLGSKGLLYGKYIADHFAEHLLNDTPLYRDIDIRRLL